jgi:hypothetical protein
MHVRHRVSKPSGTFGVSLNVTEGRGVRTARPLTRSHLASKGGGGMSLGSRARHSTFQVLSALCVELGALRLERYKSKRVESHERKRVES